MPITASVHCQQVTFGCWPPFSSFNLLQLCGSPYHGGGDLALVRRFDQQTTDRDWGRGGGDNRYVWTSQVHQGDKPWAREGGAGDPLGLVLSKCPLQSFPAKIPLPWKWCHAVCVCIFLCPCGDSLLSPIEGCIKASGLASLSLSLSLKAFLKWNWKKS